MALESDFDAIGHYVSSLFLSKVTSYSYHAFVHSNFGIWLSIITMSEGMRVSMGSTISILHKVQIEVQYSHKAEGNLSCQSLQFSTIFLIILFIFLLVASTNLFVLDR